MGNILTRMHMQKPVQQCLAAVLAVGSSFILAESMLILRRYVKCKGGLRRPNDIVLDALFTANHHDLAIGDAWKVYVNGTRLHAIKETEGWASVRAMEPFPAFTFHRPFEHRLFYFEVRIINKRGWMNIGLAANNFSLSDYYVGQTLGSFAISNWGNLFVDGEEVWGYSRHQLPSNKRKIHWFREGSVVGCGLLDLPGRGRHIFFTCDGQISGTPVMLSPEQANHAFYPIISARKMANVEANFGSGNFLFDTTNLTQLICKMKWC